MGKVIDFLTSFLDFINNLFFRKRPRNLKISREVYIEGSEFVRNDKLM